MGNVFSIECEENLIFLPMQNLQKDCYMKKPLQSEIAAVYHNWRVSMGLWNSSCTFKLKLLMTNANLCILNVSQLLILVLRKLNWSKWKYTSCSIGIFVQVVEQKGNELMPAFWLHVHTFRFEMAWFHFQRIIWAFSISKFYKDWKLHTHAANFIQYIYNFCACLDFGFWSLCMQH